MVEIPNSNFIFTIIKNYKYNYKLKFYTNNNTQIYLIITQKILFLIY